MSAFLPPRVLTSPEIRAREERSELPEAVSPILAPRFVPGIVSESDDENRKLHEGSKFDVTCYTDATVILPLEKVERIMEQLEPIIDRMFRGSFHEMDAKDLPGQKKWNKNSFHLPITLRHITQFLHGNGRFACWLLFNFYADWIDHNLKQIFNTFYERIQKIDCVEGSFNAAIQQLVREFNEWYLTHVGHRSMRDVPFDINVVDLPDGKRNVVIPYDCAYLKRYAAMHVLRMVGVLVRDAKKRVPQELQMEFGMSINPRDYFYHGTDDLLDDGVDDTTLLWLDAYITHVCDEEGGTFHYFETFDNNAVSFQALKGMVPLTPENFSACFKFNTEYFTRFVNNHLDRANNRARTIENEIEYESRRARNQLKRWDFSPEELDAFVETKVIPKLRAQCSHRKGDSWDRFDGIPQIGFTKAQLLEAIVSRAEELGTYINLPAYNEHLPTLAVMGGAFAEGPAATLGIPGLTNRLERKDDRFREGIKYNGSKYTLMCVYWAMNKCYQFEDWKQLINEDNYAEIHNIMRALGFSVPRDPATLDLADAFAQLQVANMDDQ